MQELQEPIQTFALTLGVYNLLETFSFRDTTSLCNFLLRINQFLIAWILS